MLNQFLVIMGIAVLVTLLILIQVYLSTRPSITWGFMIPIFFCLIWLYVSFDLGASLMEITANQLGINYMSWLSLMGMLLALLILFVCRQRVASKTRSIDQQRKQEHYAKQQKLAAMAALSGENDANKFFAEQEYERMLKAKAAALKLSNQKEEQLQAKEQAKEEKRLAKEQAKEEKRLAEEQAKEENGLAEDQDNDEKVQDNEEKSWLKSRPKKRKD